MVMKKQYICDLCKKNFNKKNELVSHKKEPCLILDDMVQMKKVKTDEKNKLITIFKNYLNILRDNEGLTGEKALRNISYFLILKLLEPHIGVEINFDDYEYDFSDIVDELVEKHKTKLLHIVRFSNLSNEHEDDLNKNIKYLWDDLLSKHPSTKNIFLKGKGFDIKYKSTFKSIISKLNSLDLSNIEYDILGSAYEEVAKDNMTGKTLGQFFTQPLVKKLMVELINPQILPDGKIETCCDPAMGTGGFLITYLQRILEDAKNKNIKLDWNFISTEGLYGKELEPDTYQLAVSNMLISSGHIFEKLECGDSIREPITRKFDNILANPPFGIKGLKYNDFQNLLKNEYLPIKLDSAVPLFIQAIIYMLKINGKCAVVLPAGQDLFSKTNKKLIAIREYLLKTCDLKEIIHLPNGIFEYTSTETCVFYFVKKIDGTNVLEIKSKISKATQKEISRSYVFSKIHQTTNVMFYEYNHLDDTKKLLVEVPIEKIANNSYSLNYAEYIEKETKEEYNNEIVVKSLDELFYITKGSLQSSKNIEGEYPFITASDINKTHNTFSHDCECVMLVGGAEGSLAKAHYFKGKFIASDLLFILISKTLNEINYRYIWYYLNFNKQKHLLDNTICIGTPKKMISKERCSNIKIPIPSIKLQQKIVEYFDFIYEKSNKTSLRKIEELKQLNKMRLDNVKTTAVKTLGEVCDFLNGEKRNASEAIENGKYRFITCSIQGYSYLNEYDFEEKALIINSINGSGRCMIYCTDKYSTTNNNLHFKVKNKKQYLTEYIYYYLYHNINLLENGFIGSNQKKISKEYISNLEIPIPSLKRQQSIVEYCEKNDILIKSLEEEIKDNEKLAKQFITEMLEIDTE
jgi:type I restriction enzyme S subunit